MINSKRTLPVLPLKNTVVFPQLFFPISAARKISLTAIDRALEREDKSIISVTQLRPEDDEVSFDNIFKIGTRSTIKKIMRSSSSVTILVNGIERVELLDLKLEDEYFHATYRPLPLQADDPLQIEALEGNLLEIATNIQMLSQPDAQISMPDIVANVSNPAGKAYLLATLFGLSFEKEQKILEATSAAEVLKLTTSYLRHEQQVLDLRKKIASRATNEMTKDQRQYMLRQQLRAIQEELGEGGQDTDVEALRIRAKQAELPTHVLPEFERELNRLSQLQAASPEFQVVRSYIDLILELPWNKSTNDILDLTLARQVLDTDHFNLKDIKDRIIEHLAVMKLNPKAKSPILCLVGPPGTGKTSLGQSIARALGRVFERISLGGLHDEAELRGHRRTYIGAMPGRIIQGIRRAKVNNPVLMLDEIDKLGRDFRGDPAAALMEILDPVQNVSFRDNYLDLDFNLSKVFFITTANTLETIPGPLLDRMEILRLSGYTEEEKLEIAKRYLLPRQIENAGLKSATIRDGAIQSIIRNYTREAGVRDLDRSLGRICRKIATAVAQGQTETPEVKAEQLATYLGPEKFFQERARKQARPGVATGLAWTEAGGDVLYIETKVVNNREGLTMTGQLGEVMRESIQAALSFVASGEVGNLEIPSKSGIHVHVPAGAIPKDGPSAGLAIATAIASLYTHRPMRKDTAMTGEITLSGLVLPVGGIKEKVLAARRAGIYRVILPKANAKDLVELPAVARNEMKFIFVEDVRAGIQAALEDDRPADYRTDTQIAKTH